MSIDIIIALNNYRDTFFFPAPIQVNINKYNTSSADTQASTRRDVCQLRVVGTTFQSCGEEITISVHLHSLMRSNPRVVTKFQKHLDTCEGRISALVLD